MKTLFLVRHAQSSWKDSRLADFDRPLNKCGERNAPCVGSRLRKHHMSPDLILSSPARRALRTAQIIAQEIDYPTEEIIQVPSIYKAGLEDLLEVLQEIHDDLSTVMLFGHNPSFNMVAEYLTNEPIRNIPTCGIVCIDFNLSSWCRLSQGSGDLKFFDYPKKGLAL